MKEGETVPLEPTPPYFHEASDYRAVRFYLASKPTLLGLWGIDFFVWHIPLLKLTLGLDVLIVWWLR